MLYELKRQDAYSINDERMFTLAHDYEDAINKFTEWLVKDTAWDTTVVNYDINNDELVRETEVEGLDDLIVTRYKVILRSSIDLLDSDLNDLKENILKGKIGIEDRWLIADIIDYILEARSTKPFKTEKNNCIWLQCKDAIIRYSSKH